MKLKEKEKAIMLRKKGGSIREISKELGVAKSSVSLWVRNISLSIEAQKIIQKKYTNGQLKAQIARRSQTTEKLKSASQFAQNVLGKFSPNNSVNQVICAMLYWCEGTKSINDYEFAFTNSDPDLVCVFLKLFRLSFPIEEQKFRVCVHLHDYHDVNTQLQFWSKVTKIPLSQFIKPYRKPHTGKQQKEGYQGCVQISYHDVRVARELQAITKAYVVKYKGL